MAVKAVCMAIELVPKGDTGEFTAHISFASIPDGIGLSGQMSVDLEPSALPTVMVSIIKAAVKAYLQGQGVEFGLLDTVQYVDL